MVPINVHAYNESHALKAYRARFNRSRARSSPIEFTVIETIAEGEGEVPSGGIPGFPLGSIILGLVLSMSLLYVIGHNQGVR
jgi:hypothetical protein